MASLVLSSVFIASGLGKIGRVAPTREMLRRFRLPRIASGRVAATLLPIVELVVGVGLVVAPPGASSLMAAAAVCFTAAFVVVTGRAWRNGDTFDCDCFGPYHRSPVSGALVLRNVALLVLALLVLSASLSGYDGVLTVVTDIRPSDVVWSVVAVALAVTAALFVFSARSATSPVSASAPSSRKGGVATIPPIEVTTAVGSVMRLVDLVAIEPVLLVFVRPGCTSCERVMETAPRTLTTRARIVFAVDSAPQVFRESHPELMADAVFAVLSAKEKLGVTKMPSAVLIGLNGEWIAGPVAGVAEIEELLVSATGYTGATTGVRTNEGSVE
ncbi:Methylamine utilisation protein MauE [Herbiconiux ginsengi]|uniref:Methylamine utilisation protein MauE n=2 Tax=Herbiconiux ginsengi TaxID=381665 RepID=A0A1H3SQ07_9MICO|nr:Methylamine utilisation protein MauE [Herbiconiux ginsengi]